VSFCNNCGGGISAGAQFCENCGATVIEPTLGKAPISSKLPLVLLGVGGGVLLIVLVLCLASGLLVKNIRPSGAEGSSVATESFASDASGSTKYKVAISQNGPVNFAKATVTVSDGSRQIQQEMMNPGNQLYPSSIFFTSQTGSIDVMAQSDHESDVVGISVRVYKWEGNSGKLVTQSECQGSYCIAQCSYP